MNSFFCGEQLKFMILFFYSNHMDFKCFILICIHMELTYSSGQNHSEDFLVIKIFIFQFLIIKKNKNEFFRSFEFQVVIKKKEFSDDEEGTACNEDLFFPSSTIFHPIRSARQDTSFLGIFPHHLKPFLDCMKK